MSPLSQKEVQAALDRRGEFEAANAEKDCPNCPHKIAKHCSRNENVRPDRLHCCPGYCFADDECNCIGYAS